MLDHATRALKSLCNKQATPAATAAIDATNISQARPVVASNKAQMFIAPHIGSLSRTPANMTLASMLPST